MTRPHPLRLTLAGLLVVIVMGGCVEGGTSATAAGQSAATASGGPTATRPGTPSSGAVATSPGEPAKPSPSVAAGIPSTTETAWGRIWDALPAAFPAYPGAEPADTGEGPASAVLDVPAKAAKAVAWYDKALVNAGYTIEALSGPLEDGSTVIDAVGGDPACRVQASIVPHGSRSIATILMGADCPFG